MNLSCKDCRMFSECAFKHNFPLGGKCNWFFSLNPGFQFQNKSIKIISSVVTNTEARNEKQT